MVSPSERDHDQLLEGFTTRHWGVHDQLLGRVHDQLLKGVHWQQLRWGFMSQGSWLASGKGFTASSQKICIFR